ncbi:MAG: urease accessory protein UreE [Desertifilum sp. SIO1I2]|nr:urease accessory protein UreE [Desertifilum sp. SIO1I2]
MNVITEILGTLSTLRSPITQTDALILTSEERLSPHRVGRTVGDRTVRISLPRSAELFDGDVLALDGDVAIVVEAASEDLFVISPTDKLTWGVVGFQLGNLHRPVRFTETSILTPVDPVVAEMFGRIGIAFERQMTPFIGQRYGSQASSHSHGSTHTHSHAH